MVWTMSLKWRAEGMVFVCSDVRHGSTRKLSATVKSGSNVLLSLFFLRFVLSSGGFLGLYLLSLVELITHGRAAIQG